MFKYALRVLFSCSAALRDYQEHEAVAVGAQLGVRVGAELSIRIFVFVEADAVLFGSFLFYLVFFHLSVFAFKNGML